MSIKKYLKILLIVLLSIFVIYIIYAFTLEERVLMTKKIENYIPIYAKMDKKNTHRGFHNDGELLEKIYFSEKQANNFINSAEKNSNWRQLPITERLHNKVCKHAIDEEMNIPEVSNGYWFVLDRHSVAKDKYNEKDIFNEDRYSYNFTIAVFDIEQNVLYIYELDT